MLVEGVEECRVDASVSHSVANSVVCRNWPVGVATLAVGDSSVSHSVTNSVVLVEILVEGVEECRVDASVSHSVANSVVCRN